MFFSLRTLAVKYQILNILLTEFPLFTLLATSRYCVSVRKFTSQLSKAKLKKNVCFLSAGD